MSADSGVPGELLIRLACTGLRLEPRGTCLETRPVLPATLDCHRAERLHGKLRPHGAGIGAMETAPAVLPDGGASVPAFVAAGEQHLEAFGEAGLAGAVAADDECEPGAGRERQSSRGPDAAEAFDGDAAQVGPWRFRDRGVGGFRARPRGPWRRVSIQGGGQRLGAAAGGEHEIRPGLVAVLVGDQPIEDAVRECVRIRPGSCHGP